MHFEHLIQINDPLNPLVAPLTREQLWEGLVLRAEQPQLFVIGLDSCTILSRTATTLERTLHYGQAIVRDHVTLTPQHSVRYDIVAHEAQIGGSLTMTIEQPDEDALRLFLRFEYRTTLSPADNQEARQTSEIIQAAYREADKDTVRLIREFVQHSQDPNALH